MYERRPMVFVLLLAGCLASACSTRSEGIALELGVMHHPGEGHEGIHYPAGAERGFITDVGYGIVLRRAQLVIGRVELRRCDEEAPDATSALLKGLREWLSPLSVAHAHGLNSATVLAVPTVLDLIDEDRNAISMARMRPPPGAYCGLTLRVEPADPDAVGLPELDGERAGEDDGSLVGLSLLAEGLYVEPGDPVEHPFSYHTELPDEVELDFVDSEGAAARIELTEREPVAELRIEISYYGLLDGIELADYDGLVHPFMIVRNLLSNARAVVNAPAKAPGIPSTGVLGEGY